MINLLFEHGSEDEEIVQEICRNHSNSFLRRQIRIYDIRQDVEDTERFAESAQALFRIARELERRNIEREAKLQLSSTDYGSRLYRTLPPIERPHNEKET